MKNIASITLLIVELMLPLGLLAASWKLFEIYSLSFSIISLFLYMLLIPTHLKILKKKHPNKAIQFRLVFITGSSISLCLSMILYTSISLRRIDTIGTFLTKEMREIDRRGWVDIGCLDDDCRIYRLKSERMYCTMLLASLCILYKTRYTVISENTIKVNKSDSNDRFMRGDDDEST